MTANSSTPEVRRLHELRPGDVLPLLQRAGLRLAPVAAEADIPGSFWGAPEAGVIRDTVWVRDDTPVHSILHTLGHVICMDAERRAALHTDCGGTDEEEAAVCFLQASLADALPGYGRDALWRDMDAWGYSFRLGAARRWHARDAADALAWLTRLGLADGRGDWTGRTRA